jgi:hypothetical protein
VVSNNDKLPLLIGWLERMSAPFRCGLEG